MKKFLSFTIIFILAMGFWTAPISVEVVEAQEYYEVVDSYDEFYNTIKGSMSEFHSKITIKINDYDENTYSFNKVIDDVIEKNPEIYYHYGGATGSIRSYYSNQIHRTIDIYFRYRGTKGELKDLVGVSDYDEYKSAIANTLDSFDDKLLVKVNNYEEEKYNLDKAIYKVLSEVPDLDYGINGWSVTVYGNGSDKIVEAYINYSFSKKKMEMMKEEVDKKAHEIIDEIIKPGMKDYEKELIIHDYIINNAEYNTSYYDVNSVPEDEHTAYGVLIKGKGVCSSYAKAMHKMMEMVGIESYFVTGAAGGESHAWNIVKIQGRYYHVDLTWDDPIVSSGDDILSHDYFNLTDYEIGKDHSWIRDDYPRANSVIYSYDNIDKILSGEIDAPHDEENSDIKSIKELPNNTVIIGYNGFDIEFANNRENKEIIKNALNQGEDAKVYVKMNGEWFREDGSNADVEEIPDITYTSDGENFINYLSVVENLEEKDNIIVEVDDLVVGSNVNVNINVNGDENYPNAKKYSISGSDDIKELGEKTFVFPAKKDGSVIEVSLYDDYDKLIYTGNITILKDINRPENLKATAVSENKIQLYWDKVEGADYYYVYESSTLEGVYEPYLNSDGENEKYYWFPDYCLEVLDVNPNTTLYFKVVAVVGGEESEFSEIAYATTDESIASKAIATIKEGNLYSYKESTIGEAFGKYFTNPKWKYFKSTEEEHVVEFSGKSTYDNELVDILIQFTVNPEDDSFYINYKEKDGNKMANSLWLSLLNNIYK